MLLNEASFTFYVTSRDDSFHNVYWVDRGLNLTDPDAWNFDKIQKKLNEKRSRIQYIMPGDLQLDPDVARRCRDRRAKFEREFKKANLESFYDIESRNIPQDHLFLTRDDRSQEEKEVILKFHFV